MYNEHVKALIAAQAIREYCESRPNGSCLDCIFMTKETQEWGFACVLTDTTAPDKWDLTEAGGKMQ